jgi:hypothetical protein
MSPDDRRPLDRLLLRWRESAVAADAHVVGVAARNSGLHWSFFPARPEAPALARGARSATAIEAALAACAGFCDLGATGLAAMASVASPRSDDHLTPIRCGSDLAPVLLRGGGGWGGGVDRARARRAGARHRSALGCPSRLPRHRRGAHARPPVARLQARRGVPERSAHRRGHRGGGECPLQAHFGCAGREPACGRDTRLRIKLLREFGRRGGPNGCPSRARRHSSGRGRARRAQRHALSPGSLTVLPRVGGVLIAAVNGRPPGERRVRRPRRLAVDCSLANAGCGRRPGTPGATLLVCGLASSAARHRRRHSRRGRMASGSVRAFAWGACD